jgi:hypothetical protein
MESVRQCLEKGWVDVTRSSGSVAKDSEPWTCRAETFSFDLFISRPERFLPKRAGVNDNAKAFRVVFHPGVNR